MPVQKPVWTPLQKKIRQGIAHKVKTARKAAHQFSKKMGGSTRPGVRAAARRMGQTAHQHATAGTSPSLRQHHRPVQYHAHEGLDRLTREMKGLYQEPVNEDVTVFQEFSEAMELDMDQTVEALEALCQMVDEAQEISEQGTPQAVVFDVRDDSFSVMSIQEMETRNILAGALAPIFLTEGEIPEDCLEEGWFSHAVGSVKKAVKHVVKNVTSFFHGKKRPSTRVPVKHPGTGHKASPANHKGPTITGHHKAMTPKQKAALATAQKASAQKRKGKHAPQAHQTSPQRKLSGPYGSTHEPTSYRKYSGVGSSKAFWAARAQHPGK
jgi:hypothetical protein